MPFRAFVDGKIVTPSQVRDQQAVVCPGCSGILYPRDGDYRARHFYHIVDKDAESCSTTNSGESETHARCVALAVSELSARFPDAARVGAEISLDVAGTKTTPDTRRADALVEFRDTNPYFGNGLIIEVQYKHHSKDIQGTTHDYLSTGFSVAWLTPEDFDDNSLSSAVVDEAFQDDGRQAYNVPGHDPWEFETQVETNFDWEPPSLNCFQYNEVGKHDWKKIPSYAHPAGYEYEFCPSCGSRRQYDNEIGRFVYDHEEILAPQIRPAELRSAVIPHPQVADDFDDWEREHGDSESFESCLSRKPEVAPCRSLLGVHEWNKKEIVEQGVSDGRPEVVLWECQHCPVHLLTNFSRHGEVQAYILFGKEPDPEWGLSHLNGNPRFCQFWAHNDDQDWDYCSKCFQLNP